MLEVDRRGFLERLSLPHGADPFGDEAVVAVDCSGAAVAPEGEPVAARLRGLPAVVVAVDAGPDDPLAAALDVAVDGGGLGAVADAVERHSDAAVALAVLLRGSEERSIAEGLAAESATYSTLQAGPDHRAWLASRRPRARPPEPGPAVAVERGDDELRLRLDRPAVRNAFNAAMRDALVEALAVAAADPGLRVVIEGSGPAFCSGGDLDEFGTGPDPAAAHRLRLRRSAARAIADVADRVTVLVHGATVGAGVELSAFAARVVAAPDTRFSLPEVSMGLVPGAGGTVSVPRRVGRQRAALLALTGTAIDAATALDWGLVDEISGGGRGPAGR